MLIGSIRKDGAAGKKGDLLVHAVEVVATCCMPPDFKVTVGTDGYAYPCLNSMDGVPNGIIDPFLPRWVDRGDFVTVFLKPEATT